MSFISMPPPFQSRRLSGRPLPRTDLQQWHFTQPTAAEQPAQFTERVQERPLRGSARYVHVFLSSAGPFVRASGLGKVVPDRAKFRSKRKRQEAQAISDLEGWVKELQELVAKHFKEVALTTANPAVDTRQTRHTLLRRWRRQQHNRKLKIHIAKLTDKAEHYAEQLA